MLLVKIRQALIAASFRAGQVADLLGDLAVAIDRHVDRERCS